MSFLRPVLRSFSRTGCGHVPVRTCLTYDRGGGYEGDGKTSLVVLNRDVNDRLLIDSYSTDGFRLNSGVFVCGPAAFFPRTLLSWDVEGPWDVTIDSLSLFWLMEPKPDILVLGVGDSGNTIADEVRIFLNQKKINLMLLDTAQACGIFNFMNADHRNVAAALIPCQTMRLVTDAQHYDNVLVKRRLWTMYGSSMNEVIEERERKDILEIEDAIAQSMKGTYAPMNEAKQRDLSEMVMKGMMSEADARKAYPQLQLKPKTAPPVADQQIPTSPEPSDRPDSKASDSNDTNETKK